MSWVTEPDLGTKRSRDCRYVGEECSGDPRGSVPDRKDEKGVSCTPKGQSWQGVGQHHRNLFHAVSYVDPDSGVVGVEEDTPALLTRRRTERPSHRKTWDTT